ncbi:MAG TPA: ATP-binding protein, partial [Gaiellaceae bacterium]
VGARAHGMTPRLRQAQQWIALVRVAAIPFAVLEVGVFTPSYPRGYELWAWLVTAIFVVGALALLAVVRRSPGRAIALAALAFDTAILVAYLFVYAYEADEQVKALLFLPVIEAAFIFGLPGGLAMPLVTAPFLVGAEAFRESRFGFAFNTDHVTFAVGLELVVGAIVGRLTNRLEEQTGVAQTRAGEAERLRDALARRVDLLEAANRCARALGSSLELEPAFAAFIRELRGLVPFDRVAIVLGEDGVARVIATSGVGAEVFPPGSFRPIEGSVLAQVLQGEAVYREDMADARYPEEDDMARLGLRSRLCAPLLLGARAIGMLSVVRREPASFTEEEIELTALLGRLVATAVQNIRAYEAERATADELRRLSSLRADFVSLVSHELRTPMAAVIGAAQTLQQRWRELSAEQRSSFLTLIAGETTRLAALIGDVLDTSRIDAGTFSFSFEDVDIEELVDESVAAAAFAQDEVQVRASLARPLPHVRGDRERLRQVLVNLIDNAVKYSPAGDEVEVSGGAENGTLRITVRDNGPGIAPEHQKLIFEKFGRAKVAGKAKPGTGLGLFIARSIAEAHGGSVEVESAPQRGATFTLELPA